MAFVLRDGLKMTTGGGTLMTRRKQDFQRRPLVGVGFLTSLSLLTTQKNVYQKICPGKFEKWLFLAWNIKKRLIFSNFCDFLLITVISDQDI